MIEMGSCLKTVTMDCEDSLPTGWQGFGNPQGTDEICWMGFLGQFEMRVGQVCLSTALFITQFSIVDKGNGVNHHTKADHQIIQVES